MTDTEWWLTILPFLLESSGAFHSTKTSENWKRWRMVRKFPVKISRKFGNCWISEARTIQPRVLKIPWAKLNGKKTFRKFGYTTLRCPALWKFLKIQFHSILEVVETLSKVVKKRKFWLNGKRPIFSGKFPRMMSCQIFRFQFRISVSAGYAKYIAQTLIPSPRRFELQQMGSTLSYFFSKGDDSKEKDSSTVQVRRRHSTFCIELNRNSFTKLSVSGQLV